MVAYLLMGKHAIAIDNILQFDRLDIMKDLFKPGLHV